MRTTSATGQVRYALQLQVVTEAVPTGFGHSDAAVLAALTRLPEHGLQVDWASMDGTTAQPIASAELFRVWLALAQQLADDPTLHHSQRALCAAVFARMHSQR
jgi:hypothetical protein